MNYLIPSLLGVTLSLTVFILGIVQTVYQDFVIARLATNEDGGLSGNVEIEEEIVVATLGVFQTTYDPSELNDAQFSASGLPEEKRTGDTIGFPLLFPAQSNFVADILPLSVEGLSSLGDLELVATALLGPSLEAVEDLEFDTCDQYLEDADEALTAVFAGVEGILPQLPLLLYGDLSEELNLVETLTELSGNMANPLTAPIGAIYFGFVEAAAEAAATINSDCQPTLNALIAVLGDAPAKAALGFTGFDYACLSSGFALIDTFSSFSLITAEMVEVCGDDVAPLTLGDCYFGQFSGALVAVEGETLADEPTFIGQNICDLGLSCTNKVAYLFFVGNVLNSTQIDPLDTYGQGMILMGGLFANLLRFTGFSSEDSILIELISNSTSESLPVTLADDYIPCAILATLDGRSDEPCNYTNFLETSAALAAETGSSTAQLIAQISQLYSACAGVGFPTASCPRLFGALFVNGAFQSPLDTTELLTEAAIEGIDSVYGVISEECEDDVEDVEIFEEAHGVFIVGISCYGVSLLGGLFGLLAPSAKGIVFLLSGLVVIVGGILNFSALLVARTAPVYQVVGDGERSLNSVFYESGSIPLIALVAMILALLAGMLYFTGGYFAYKAEEENLKEETKKVDVVGEEVKEAEKVEEPPEEKKEEKTPSV
eukprot:augustus_masked-scaffold_6-processed-gene-8.47-mRNA-1 protein AED:1.00 eAED:1.00 QI:0/-1/0/0/-1/1/1/0/659